MEGFERLSCSQCATGHYITTVPGTAQCDTCGDLVDIIHDIAPYLEDGEALVSYVDTYVNIVRQEA